jgi:hypothetical protein
MRSPAVVGVPPVETGGYNGTKSAFADSGEEIGLGSMRIRAAGGSYRRTERIRSARTFSPEPAKAGFVLL